MGNLIVLELHLPDTDGVELLRSLAARGCAAPIVLMSGVDQRVLLAPTGAPEARGEGEVFGLLSFLDGEPSAVTVRASADAPVELLRITPENLQQLAAWQPRIAVLLLRDLGAHVAARLRRLQPGD